MNAPDGITVMGNDWLRADLVDQMVAEAVAKERDRLVEVCSAQKSGLGAGIDEGVRRCIAAIRRVVD